MKFVAVPIWDAAHKENDLKTSTVVKEYFNNDKAVLFNQADAEKGITFTKNYKEFLETDFSNAFLEMYLEHGNLKINLIPKSWKNTNPAYIDFFKRDKL